MANRSLKYIQGSTVKSPPALLAAMLILSAAFFSLSPSPRVRAQEPAREKPDRISFTSSDTLNYDLDAEIMNVPGEVEIEYGELSAQGTNLYYNNKDQTAALHGEGKVTASYGPDITMALGYVYFDARSETLTATGGVTFRRSTAGGDLRVDTESIRMHTGESWLRSMGDVSLQYKSAGADAGEGTEPDKTEPDKNQDVESEKDDDSLPEFEELAMNSGRIYYNIRDQWIAASGPVFIEFDGGNLEAGEVSGSLAEKDLELTGGISGRSGEISITADSARLKYATDTQEIEAFGNIEIIHDEGHSLNAEYMWMKYTAGDRAFKIRGSAREDLKMIMKMDNKSAGGTGDESAGGSENR